jgi:hypothetical protein
VVRKKVKDVPITLIMKKIVNIYVGFIPELILALPELSGKVLGCWCKPERCHGDVLSKLLGDHILSNSKPENNGK